MQEKYLPLGTVCRLKDGQKNLMIIGFMASANEANGKMFDYIGALHPEGVLSTDMNFLFNHDQIEEVLFTGLVNEEETTFKRRLHEFSTNGTIDGQVPSMNNDVNRSDAVVKSPQPTIQNVNVSQPQMFTGNNQ